MRNQVEPELRKPGLFIVIIIFIASCSTQPASKITSLDLGNQKLLSIPDSVFTLTGLEYLSLGNSFVMYPPLSVISDGNHGNDSLNCIREIPEDIGNLQQLKVLDISANNLQSLPENITELKKLERLELCFNSHFDAKTEFRKLSRMTWLKNLNIATTKNAIGNADMLRKVLPDTKIIATIEEMTVPLPDSKDSSN